MLLGFELNLTLYRSLAPFTGDSIIKALESDNRLLIWSAK